MRHTFGDKKGRLTIIDPNRPENNISGGTSGIQKILHAFSLAHQGLLQRLDDLENLDSDEESKSILEYIVGGDFTAYDLQRQMLYDLYDASAYVQQAISQVPPPPPATETLSIPPPPPPPPAAAVAARNSKPAVTGANGKASNGKVSFREKKHSLNPNFLLPSAVRVARQPTMSLKGSQRAKLNEEPCV